VKTLPKAPATVFFAFVAALLGAMLVAAIASPWMQWLLAPVAQFPLHRVFSRLTMLGVVAISLWLLLRYGLMNREVLGYGGPWPQFLRRAAIGLVLGAGLMQVALLPLFLLHVLAWNAHAPASGTGWFALGVKGLGSGIVVALIEETFFRGAMQGALQRMGATRWALFAVPLLYAAVHFLGRPAGVPYESATGASGFTMLAIFVGRFGEPLGIVDAFVALWCVGLLLALVRRRWGDLGACIGLHAGFVATIYVLRKVSAPAPANEWSFLVGSFDGLLGWWIAAAGAVACAILWRFFTRPAVSG